MMRYAMGTIIFCVIQVYAHTASAGVLHGQVQHQNLAPVGGVEITATKKGEGSVKKTTTNSSGIYSIELDSGAYTLEVQGVQFEVRISDQKKRKDLKLP